MDLLVGSQLKKFDFCFDVLNVPVNSHAEMGTTINEQDTLYKYSVTFENVDLKENYQFQHLIEHIYDHISPMGILMDIRAEGSIESSKGIFDRNNRYVGSKYEIRSGTVGIVTFKELDSETRKWICDTKTYQFAVNQMDRIDYRCDKADAIDLEMELTLYEIDEHGHSFCACPCYRSIYIPLIGLYKGIYSDVNASRSSRSYINYMRAGSWNHKNPLVIESLRKMTAKKIRDISLNFINTHKHYWSLGFGID